MESHSFSVECRRIKWANKCGLSVPFVWQLSFWRQGTWPGIHCAFLNVTRNLAKSSRELKYFVKYLPCKKIVAKDPFIDRRWDRNFYHDYIVRILHIDDRYLSLFTSISDGFSREFWFQLCMLLSHPSQFCHSFLKFIRLTATVNMHFHLFPRYSEWTAPLKMPNVPLCATAPGIWFINSSCIFRIYYKLH